MKNIVHCLTLALAILVFVVSGCAQKVDVEAERATLRNADEEAIKNLRKEYMAAQDAGDVEGCLSFWADDCVLMPPNEPAVVGKDAGRSWYSNAFDQFKIDFTVTFDVIEVVGNWSFAIGSYKGSIIPKAGGEPIQDNGKYLEIHRRQPDGSWKFACHMWSSDNPAAREVTPEETTALAIAAIESADFLTKEQKRDIFYNNAARFLRLSEGENADLPAQAFLTAPRVSMIEVAPDVRLEVLEWSTDGLPLVLLAGATHTAHVYEHFAPYFTDRFRVVGITRRRHGASDASQEPFGITDLANDIVAVLDSLSIESAFFMGHSFGGAEMNQLALDHPERLRKLVYLDGARDFYELYYSDGWWDRWPDIPMEEEDKTSPQAVAAYFARTFGVAPPLEDILSAHRFDSDGRLVALNPNIGNMFQELIMPTLEPLEHSRFNTPVLVVRAIPETVADLFGGYDSYDPENQRLADEAFQKWVRASSSSDRFVEQVADVLELRIEGGNHDVINVHAGEILPPIREFLLE